jgi:hypothetical protein
MADLIKTGQQWEASKRKAYRSATVSIKRGASTTTGVTAAIGSTRLVAADSNGVMFEERVRDYIIDVADYRISGVAVEPNENDRIIDSSSGTTLTFQVLPEPGGAEKRWSDPYGIAWRIHTKQVLA